ncbi:MAG: S41 family peptidase [Bacteroidales bacterium]|nr:S41 family peptidase [Bacteroidales bacterium]
MRRLLLLTPIILVLSSCEKLLVDEEYFSPAASFDYLWHTIDEEYALFDVKGIDWDSARRVYAPRAYSSQSLVDLFAPMADMLNLLDDGHVNLIAPFDISRSEEVFLQTYGQSNFDLNTVSLNYLGPDYHTTGGLAYNALRDGKVIYVRYSSFSNSVSTEALKLVAARYPHAEGMVLDMRQNGGGSISNIWEILSFLPGNNQLLYRTQIKSGPAHDAFAPPEEVRAPASEQPYVEPVVLLTDRGSYSATSMFALCCRSYPTVTTVGDTTGGGLGLPKGRQLPNGWYVRYSVSRILSPEGKNFENGVPPDVVVTLDPMAVASGVDNVIEHACDIIQGLDN